MQRLFHAVVAVPTAAHTTAGDELTDAMVMWEAVHVDDAVSSGAL